MFLEHLVSWKEVLRDKLPLSFSRNRLKQDSNVIYTVIPSCPLTPLKPPSHTSDTHQKRQPASKLFPYNMLNRGKRESNYQKNRTISVCCTGQTRHFSPDSFPSWTLPAWTYTAGTRALLPSSPVLGLSLRQLLPCLLWLRVFPCAGLAAKEHKRPLWQLAGRPCCRAASTPHGC